MNSKLSTIDLHPFDPAFADQYKEGDRVEFALEGWDFDNLLRGTIRGKSSQGLINIWIVQVDEPIPGWEFSCITVQHTFMRLIGSNEPFPNGK